METENIKKSLEKAINEFYKSFHADMWIEFWRFNTSSLATYLSSGHLKEGYIDAFLEALCELGIVEVKRELVYYKEYFKINSNTGFTLSGITDFIIEAKERDAVATKQNEREFNVAGTTYILSDSKKKICEVKVVKVMINVKGEITYTVIDNEGNDYLISFNDTFRSPEELTANLLNNVVRLKG